MRSIMQVPPPSYHSAFDQHGLPANDLERLMSCVTPVLELDGELAKGSEALRTLRLVSRPHLVCVTPGCCAC